VIILIIYVIEICNNNWAYLFYVFIDLKTKILMKNQMNHT